MMPDQMPKLFVNLPRTAAILVLLRFTLAHPPGVHLIPKRGAGMSLTEPNCPTGRTGYT